MLGQETGEVKRSDGCKRGVMSGYIHPQRRKKPRDLARSDFSLACLMVGCNGGGLDKFAKNLRFQNIRKLEITPVVSLTFVKFEVSMEVVKHYCTAVQVCTFL